MAIEIVDFPMKNGGSFQFAMLIYQGVKNNNRNMVAAPVEVRRSLSALFKVMFFDSLFSSRETPQSNFVVFCTKLGQLIP